MAASSSSSRARRAGMSGRLGFVHVAQYAPGHIGAQFFAANYLVQSSRKSCPFDCRAMLCRDPAVGVEPRPDVSPISEAACGSQGGLPPKDFGSSRQGQFLGRGLSVHRHSLRAVDCDCQPAVDSKEVAFATFGRMAKSEWDEEMDAALGSRLKAVRVSRGLSIDQVGVNLKVSRATVNFWETGKRAIKHHDLAAICFLFGISADELLFGVRRWPFDKIDFDSVNELEPVEIAGLQGGLVVLAGQLGIKIKQLAA